MWAFFKLLTHFPIQIGCQKSNNPFEAKDLFEVSTLQTGNRNELF